LHFAHPSSAGRPRSSARHGSTAGPLRELKALSLVRDEIAAADFEATLDRMAYSFGTRMGAILSVTESAPTVVGNVAATADGLASRNAHVALVPLEAGIREASRSLKARTPDAMPDKPRSRHPGVSGGQRFNIAKLLRGSKFDGRHERSLGKMLHLTRPDKMPPKKSTREIVSLPLRPARLVYNDTPFRLARAAIDNVSIVGHANGDYPSNGRKRGIRQDFAGRSKLTKHA